MNEFKISIEDVKGVRRFMVSNGSYSVIFKTMEEAVSFIKERVFQ